MPSRVCLYKTQEKCLRNVEGIVPSSTIRVIVVDFMVRD